MTCAALIRFASDCDLLLYDAQYTETEYEKCRGYGHSTPQVGLEVAAKANVGKILFVHHAPQRTDSELSRMEQKFSMNGNEVAFAKAGDKFFCKGGVSAVNENLSTQQILDNIFAVMQRLYDEMRLNKNGESEHSRIFEIFAELGRTLVDADRASFWRWDKRNGKLLTTAVAERIRQAAMNSVCRFEDEEIRVTMSFGCSEVNPLLTIEENIKIADERLYRAKKTGRNKVICRADFFRDEQGKVVMSCEEIFGCNVYEFGHCRDGQGGH